MKESDFIRKVAKEMVCCMGDEFVGISYVDPADMTEEDKENTVNELNNLISNLDTDDGDFIPYLVLIWMAYGDEIKLPFDPEKEVSYVMSAHAIGKMVCDGLKYVATKHQ